MVFGLKLGLAKKASAEPPTKEPPPSKAAPGGGSKNALTVNEFVARTKKSREKGLEPTKPELIAYARYLGIDTVIDGDLMWIAEEALNAPLPSEWTEHNDSADRIFYYNVHTHKSSWTHPLEHTHRDLYKTVVNFRSGDLTKEQQSAELEKMRRKCEASEREAHQELQVWTEHTDEQGQKFFYNREQHVSVWTDPRPARCHALYLQMKALRVLGKHCGQTVSISGLEPLLHEKNRTGTKEYSSHDRGRPPVTSSNATENKVGTDDGGEATEKRRRRKRRKDEEHKANGTASDGLDSGDCQSLSPLRKPVLDMKRAQLSHEELRSDLGLTKSMQNTMSGSMSGTHHGRERAPSPLGDGLSNVGRVKVKAGIRLEPLS